jgi:hypothetical protein
MMQLSVERGRIGHRFDHRDRKVDEIRKMIANEQN